MNLTPEQKKTVSSWITAGASISDVQKRLRDEFQLSLTYIDTRFLIDDLGLVIKTVAKPAPNARGDLGAGKPAAPVPGGAKPGASPAAAQDAELVDEGDAFAAGADEFADDLPPETAPAGAVGGKVAIDIDRVMRPGTVVSGTVKFSDGQSGKWALDQMGRLVFEGATPGYRPSQADLQAFQRELSTQLQRQGY
jgi:hypothetical protein